MSGTGKFRIEIEGVLEKGIGKNLQKELDSIGKGLKLTIPTIDLKPIETQIKESFADLQKQMGSAVAANVKTPKDQTPVKTVTPAQTAATPASVKPIATAVPTEVAPKQISKKEEFEEKQKRAQQHIESMDKSERAARVAERATRKLNEATVSNYESMQPVSQADDKTKSRLARLERNFNRKYGSDEARFLADGTLPQKSVDRKHFLEQRKELESLRAIVAGNNTQTAARSQMPKFTAEDWAAADSTVNARTWMGKLSHVAGEQGKYDADYDVFQQNTREHPSTYYVPNSIALPSSEEEIVRYIKNQDGSFSRVAEAIVTQDELRNKSLRKAADGIRFAKDFERRHNIVDGIGYTIEDIKQLEISDSEEDRLRAKRVRDALGFHDDSYSDYGEFKTLRHGMIPVVSEKGKVTVDLSEEQKAAGVIPQYEQILQAREQAMISQGVDIGSRFESTIKVANAGAVLKQAENNLVLAKKKVSEYIDGFEGWSEKDQMDFILGYDSKNFKDIGDTRSLTTAVNNIRALQYGVLDDGRQETLDKATETINKLGNRSYQSLNREERTKLGNAYSTVARSSSIAELQRAHEDAVAKAQADNAAFVESDNNLIEWMNSDVEAGRGQSNARVKTPAWRQKDPSVEEEESKKEVAPEDRPIKGNDRFNNINKEIRKKRESLADMQLRHAEEIAEIEARQAAELSAEQERVSGKFYRVGDNGAKVKLTPAAKKKKIEDLKFEQAKYLETAKHTRKEEEESLQREIEELKAKREEAREGDERSETQRRADEIAEQRKQQALDTYKKNMEAGRDADAIDADRKRLQDELADIDSKIKVAENSGAGDEAITALREKRIEVQTFLDNVENEMQLFNNGALLSSQSGEKVEERNVSRTDITGTYSTEAQGAVLEANAQTQRIRDLVKETASASFGSRQEFEDFKSYARNAILSDFVTTGKDGRLEVGGVLDEALTSAGSDVNAQNVIRGMRSETRMLIGQLENSWDRIGADIDRREEEARKRPVVEPDQPSYNGRRMTPEEYYNSPEYDLASVDEERRQRLIADRIQRLNGKNLRSKRKRQNGESLDGAESKEILSKGTLFAELTELADNKDLLSESFYKRTEAVQKFSDKMLETRTVLDSLKGYIPDDEFAELERSFSDITGNKNVKSAFATIRKDLADSLGNAIKLSGEGSDFISSDDMSKRAEGAREFYTNLEKAKNALVAMKGYLPEDEYAALEQQIYGTRDAKGNLVEAGLANNDVVRNATRQVRDLLVGNRNNIQKEKDEEAERERQNAIRFFRENIAFGKGSSTVINPFTAQIWKARKDLDEVNESIGIAESKGFDEDVIADLNRRRLELENFLNDKTLQRELREKGKVYDQGYLYDYFAGITDPDSRMFPDSSFYRHYNLTERRDRLQGKLTKIEDEIKRKQDSGADDEAIAELKEKRLEIQKFLDDVDNELNLLANDISRSHTTVDVETGLSPQDEFDKRKESEEKHKKKHEEYLAKVAERREYMANGGEYYPIEGYYTYMAPPRKFTYGDYEDRDYSDYDDDHNWRGDKEVYERSSFDERYDVLQHSTGDEDADFSRFLEDSLNEAARTVSSTSVQKPLTEEKAIADMIAEREALGKKILSGTMSPTEGASAVARFRELGEQIGDGFVDVYRGASQSRIINPNAQYTQESFADHTIAQAVQDGYSYPINTSIFESTHEEARRGRREAIDATKVAAAEVAQFRKDNPLIMADESLAAAESMTKRIRANADAVDLENAAKKLGKAKNALREEEARFITEEDETSIRSQHADEKSRRKARSELAGKRARELKDEQYEKAVREADEAKAAYAEAKERYDSREWEKKSEAKRMQDPRVLAAEEAERKARARVKEEEAKLYKDLTPEEMLAAELAGETPSSYSEAANIRKQYADLQQVEQQRKEEERLARERSAQAGRDLRDVKEYNKEFESRQREQQSDSRGFVIDPNDLTFADAKLPFDYPVKTMPQEEEIDVDQKVRELDHLIDAGKKRVEKMQAELEAETSPMYQRELQKEIDEAKKLISSNELERSNLLRSRAQSEDSAAAMRHRLGVMSLTDLTDEEFEEAKKNNFEGFRGLALSDEEFDKIVVDSLQAREIVPSKIPTDKPDEPPSGGDDGGTPPSTPPPPKDPKGSKKPKEPEIDEEKIADLVDLQKQIKQKQYEMIDPELTSTSEDYARKKADLDGLAAAYQEARGAIELTDDEIKEINNSFDASEKQTRQTSESVRRLAEALREMEEASAYVDDLKRIEADESLIKKAEERKAQTRAAYEDMLRSMSITDEEGRIRERGGQLSVRDLSKLSGVRGKAFEAIDTKQLKLEAKEADAIFKDIRQSHNRMANLEVKRMELNPFDEGDRLQIEAIDNELHELEGTLDSLYSKMGNRFNKAMRDQIDADQIENEAKLARAKVKQVANIKSNYDSYKYEGEFRDVIARAESMKGKSSNLDLSSGNLRQAYSDFETVMLKDNAKLEEIISAHHKFRVELEKTKNTYKAVQSEMKAQKSTLALQKEVDAAEKLSTEMKIFGLTMKNWLNNNSAAADDFGADIESLQIKLRSCDNAADFSRIKNEFKQVTLNAELAGKATMSFGHRLKEQARRYAAYFSIAELAMEAWQGLRYMYQAVLEVDTAMVGLYRVTDLTAQEYDKLYDNMIVSAKEYGQTLTDTINATTDWIKAGFDEATSLGLAEITSVYQHISDLDYDTATENLLTAYKGFESQLTSGEDIDFGKTFSEGDTVSAVNHITDVLNELDNQFAVTSAGIGEALQRSASSMNVAGNTMEQTAALVSAAMEVTQDPEGAGSTMKILSMRLRGMKGELAELGEETDENVENISKMQGQVLNLTHGKVNIFDSDGEFRSTYDIMKDIADVWESLSTIEQADLIETIAGKHRANTVSALIGNFDHAEAMLETALDASGSAAQENEKYLDSLQGRVDVMTASFQALSTTVMDVDLLKGGIDVITGLVDAVEALIDKFSLLPAVIGLAAGALSFKGMFLSWEKESEERAEGVRVFGKSIEELEGVFSSLQSNGIDKFFADGFSKSMEKFEKEVNNDVAALNRLQKAIKANKTELSEAERMSYMEGRSVSAREYAKKMTGDSKIDAEYVEAERSKQITSMATDHSLKNRLQLVSEYNRIVGEQGAEAAMRFAANIDESDKALGKFLKGLDGGAGGAKSLIVSLVGATAKTLALEAAMSLASGAIMMLATAAIGAFINMLSEAYVSSDELAQKVDEIASSFKEQKKELKDAKSTLDNVGQRYSELSRGVDELGNNISLTSEEYAEYQNVSNQLADTFPELIKGFDSEGNAILSCKGNVDELSEAYKNLAREANNAVIQEANTIFKDFQNDKIEFSDVEEAYNQLSKIMSSTDIESAVDETIDVNSYGTTELVERLKKATGSDIEQGETINEFVKRVIADNPSTANAIINDLENELVGAMDDMQLLTEALVSNAFLGDGYKNISEPMQDLINGAISNMDFEFYSQFGSVDELRSYINNLLGQFNSIDSTDQKRLEMAFSLKTELDNGDISVGEYIDKVSKIDGILARFDEDTQKFIKISLGIDEADIDSITNKRDQLVNGLSQAGTGQEAVNRGFSQEAINKYVDGLTAGQLTYAVDLIISGDVDLSSITLSDFEALVSEGNKLKEALEYDYNIASARDGLEKLNAVMQENASSAGLTAESVVFLKGRYSELEDFDASELFVNTARGIKINEEALNEYEKALNTKTVNEMSDNIDTLRENYVRLTNEIEEAKEAGDSAAVADLYSQRDDIVEQINDISELRSQYLGLSDAYKKWQETQSGEDKGDNYVGVASEMLPTAKEDYKAGRVGTESFKIAAQYMTDDNLAGLGVEEYVKAYEEGITRMNRWFKEETGNGEEYQGLLNFLNDAAAISKKFGEEWIKINDQGQWEINVDDMDEFASAMGTSKDSLYDLFNALEAHGIKVNVQDTDLEGLKTSAQEAAEALEGITGAKYDFKFGTSDIDTVNAQFEQAYSLYQDIISENGVVDLNAEGAEEARIILKQLLEEKRLLEEQDTIMTVKVDAEQAETNVGKCVTSIQNLGNQMNILEDYKIDPEVDTSGVKSELDALKISIESMDPEVLASLMITEENKAALIESIGNIQADINAGVEPDQADIDNVQAIINGTSATVTANVLVGNDPMTGFVKVNPVPTTTDLGDGFTGNAEITVTPDKTDFGNIFRGTARITPSLTQTEFTVTVNKKEVDGTNADGTAHVNGTAFAGGTVTGRAFKQGDWSVKGSGVALGGELGQELIVRDGHFFTIGDHGAEFFNYKSGDIIFNAGQTKQLFEQGKIVNGKARGRAIASGTAFANGTIPSSGRAFNGDPYKIFGGGLLYGGSGAASYNTRKSSSSSSSSSGDADEFLEKMDWIEIAIDRIERAISRLDLTASSAFKNWTNRSNDLVKQMGKVREEIEIQTLGAKRYLEEANSVGLSESWAKKVRQSVETGDPYVIDIESITDEDLKKKIDEYRQWYEAHLDCKDAAEELKETLSELYAQKFENIITEFEGLLSIAEHTNNMIEESISQSEAKGRLTSTAYYDSLIAYEQDKQKTLAEQREKMMAQLNENVASGAIEVGSEEWVNEVTAINDVTLALKESETAILDYQKTIRELEWEQFDNLQDKISRITDESEFLIDLMSNEKLYDEDTGKLTDEGMATMGLHGQNYNTHMYQADMAGAEAAKLKAQLDADPFNEDIRERYEEMIDLQREHILAAEGEKDAIRDMVEEGINLELEALDEKIEKYNEALDSQKDLYDYQKKIKEQTEEIASLEKQMAAYAGDDSEESRARIQELKLSLEDAQEELEETEYDRYISDQQDMLDELREEYEEVLNERLDNIDELMSDMIEKINENAGEINATLEEQAKSVGTTLSDSMSEIWGVGKENSVTKVIDEYGSNFSAKLTTTNQALDAICTNVANMIGQLNILAKTDVEAAKSSNAADSDEASGGKDQPQTETTETPETPKQEDTTPPKTITVGGKINAGSARIYADSYGKGGGKQYFSSDPIYTVIKERNGYLLVRHHKSSSGYAGWFKKSDVKAYATGKRNFLSDEMAWTQEAGQEFIVRPSDGAILTPLAKGDSVLNAAASSNIWNMANSPAEFIRNNLGFGGVNVGGGSGSQMNVEQNFDKIEIVLPNVTTYDEFVKAMQKDKNVERFIHSMTVDQLAGKSSLRKGKSIR